MRLPGGMIPDCNPPGHRQRPQAKPDRRPLAVELRPQGVISAPLTPIERLNGEIKRRTDVVGIFPNDAAIVRLVGALLLKQNDEWAVQRARYMTLQTMAPLSVRQGIGPPGAVEKV